jgi:hypothetical protein
MFPQFIISHIQPLKAYQKLRLSKNESQIWLSISDMETYIALILKWYNSKWKYKWVSLQYTQWLLNCVYVNFHSFMIFCAFVINYKCFNQFKHFVGLLWPKPWINCMRIFHKASNELILLEVTFGYGKKI